jgi:hypothetical protein
MTTTSTYTLEECSKHATEKDCWLIIHGNVYDVTNFLDEHPGGYDIVVSNSGDAHRSTAKAAVRAGDCAARSQAGRSPHRQGRHGRLRGDRAQQNRPGNAQGLPYRAVCGQRPPAARQL